MRKKAGGPGADGQHAEHFARELDATLARLRSRLLDGSYQGAPISPFLANLFLDPVDKAIESKSVRLVRYADDLLLLCRSAAKAGRALDRLAALLADRGLRLHETKTRLTTFDEGFDFLGYRFEGPSLFRPEALPSCPAKVTAHLVGWKATVAD